MFCEHPLRRYPLRRTYVHRAPSYTDFVNTWKTEDGISTSLKNYNAEKYFFLAFQPSDVLFITFKC